MRIKGLYIRGSMAHTDDWYNETRTAEIELSAEDLAKQLTPMQLLDITVAQQKIVIPQLPAEEKGLQKCSICGLEQPYVVQANVCLGCMKKKQSYKVVEGKSPCETCKDKYRNNWDCKDCLSYEPEPLKRIEELDRNVTASIEGVDLQLSLQLIKDKLNEIIQQINEERMTE